MFWFHSRWGNLWSGWKRSAVTVANICLLILSIFFNVAGLWSSVTELWPSLRQITALYGLPFRVGILRSRSSPRAWSLEAALSVQPSILKSAKVGICFDSW